MSSARGLLASRAPLEQSPTERPTLKWGHSGYGSSYDMAAVQVSDSQAAADALREAEAILIEHKKKALPLVLRRRLLSSLETGALQPAAASRHATAVALAERLGLTFLPGFSNHKELLRDAHSDQRADAASEAAKGCDALAALNAALPTASFPLPSKVTRQLLLRPVEPGQRLVCALKRVHSAMRTTTTYSLSLHRVDTAEASPKQGSVASSAAGLFLLGARKVHAGQVSGSTTTCFIYATENNWQDKQCFGWVKGLRGAGSVATATVNRSVIKWDEEPSGEAPPTVTPPRLVSLGDSAAVQVVSKGPDRLASLTAVLPCAAGIRSTVAGSSTRQQPQTPAPSSHAGPEDEKLARMFVSATRDPEKLRQAQQPPAPFTAPLGAAAAPATPPRIAGAGAGTGVGTSVEPSVVPREADPLSPRTPGGSRAERQALVANLVLRSKVPMWSGGGPGSLAGGEGRHHSLALDWPDAGNWPSRKTLAVVCAHPDYGHGLAHGHAVERSPLPAGGHSINRDRRSTACLQLQRLKEADTFRLDVCCPLSPFQALAIAIAAFNE